MIDKNQIANWIVKYKRQTAVGLILLCLVIVAAITMTGKKKGEAAEAEAANAEAANAAERRLPEPLYPQPAVRKALRP